MWPHDETMIADLLSAWDEVLGGLDDLQQRGSLQEQQASPWRPVVLPVSLESIMLIDCHNHVGADLLFYLHGDFPYAQQLVQMTQEGGPLGITRWVVFPFVAYAAMDVTKFRSGGVAFGNGLETVPYAFENRRLLEECYRLFPDEGRKVLPFIMVDPMRGTDAQAAELVKLRKEYRFHGIKIQSTIIQSDIKRLATQGSARPTVPSST